MIDTLPNTALTLAQSWFSTDFWMKAWLRGPAATSEARAGTDGLAMFLWWFCVVWFVGLIALMFAFVIIYRRKPGKIAPRSASHNTPLEVAWTVIPTIFLVYMFFAGFWGYMKKVIAPGHAVEMKLVGAKWFWQLTYPEGQETNETATIGAKEIPIFYVPAGVPVKLKLISQDVSHGFYVPSFRIKSDVLSNRYTASWFEAIAPGPEAKKLELRDDKHPDKQRDGTKQKELVGVPYEDHWLFCSEYCGDEHSEMAALIRVVPEDAYRKWLVGLSEGVSPVALGQQIWKIRCASCHSVDGAKNTGPTWKDLYNNPAVPIQGQGPIRGDENYIRESILYPAAKLHEGYANQMSSFLGQLNEKQLNGIIEYMKTISVHTPKDAAAGGTSADSAAPGTTPPPEAEKPKN